ncbi:uncharacterized protein LOC133785552 [Humulus lupulus]|uniref:uncharacterized protein LOC133785552 n=1 Tax=Humulus lupulus TaxID=3486 RepID=UPI002B406FD9|nr:uncharacterized protein LOC133785552 [Humulus lupulus]
MAKTTRKTGQTSGNVPTQPPPQGVAEDATKKVDMDHRQRDSIASLEAAIQLARGKLAPASQPDQPPSTHPQQNPHSEHPQLHHNPPQPMHPQRPEQPLVVQQERPFQDPEQQPPSRVGRENNQKQRQNRVGQHPRSPRCQTTEEQNLPSRGQRPSGGSRQEESGSVVWGPSRHNNARGPTNQCRPPPIYPERSQFRDGHDYNEADSSRRNAG